MISVIIPVYKKTEQFVENLAINMPFLEACEVIIVNDDPSQSITSQLKQFNSIHLLENSRNLGFAGAVNSGIRVAKGQHIMLLNSDVRLKDNSFKNTLHYFRENPALFAVSFAQVEQHGEIVGKNRIKWVQGMFTHSPAPDMLPGISAWAEGGASIFDAHKMKELNYFDEVFNPFYWEDIDISYRAWRRGYEVLFAPEIQVEHHHESTIGSYFRKQEIKKIAYRNQLLFIWKNITDGNLLLSHILFLPLNCIRMLLHGEFQFIIALMEALPFAGIVHKKAVKETNETTVSDSAILKKLQ